MVVDRVSRDVLEGTAISEDEEESTIPSQFKRLIDAAVQKRIDQRVTELADTHILPNVVELVEKARFQETNRWGEPTEGKPRMTFQEYLVKRAEEYLSEQVNFEGKSKSEKDSYGSWNPTQTRLTYLVHQHLQYEFNTVIKNVMAGAIGTVARAIHETVRIQLNEVAAKMTVNVATGR